MANAEKIKSQFGKYLHPNDSGVHSNKENTTPSFGGGGGNGGNTMETRVSLLEHKVANIETILERIESKIDKMDAKFEDKFAKMDTKLAKMDDKFEDKIQRVSDKVDSKFMWTIGIIIGLHGLLLTAYFVKPQPQIQQPIPQQYYQQQPQQPQIIYMMAPPSQPAPVTQP